MKSKILAGLFIFSLLIPHVNAANFQFNVTLTNVIVDSGGGTYSGTGVGDSFSGTISYGDNPSQAIDTYTEANERNWEFEENSFGASLSDGVTTTNFSTSEVNLQNDWPLDESSVALLNTEFEQNVSTQTPIDAWSAGGITNGAFWIDAPTPEDPDNENIANGMIIQVAFVSYDTSLYSDLDYQPSPPSSADLAIFSIEEADGQGNILYSAIGRLDTSSVCNDVPGNVSLISPFGTTEETTPAFTWKADSCATWYKLYVSNALTGYKFVQWYEIEDNYSNYPEIDCSGGECAVIIASDLEIGDYDWWVRGWNEYGNGPWSDGLTFTVIGDANIPSKVTHTSPSGAIQDSTPTYTWEHDPASTWYKLWVGYPNGDRVFGQWYNAGNICSDGNCSITPDSELSGENYEWYVKSWSDYGKTWSNGMSFTVPTDNSKCPDVSGAWYFTWKSDARDCGEGIEDFLGTGVITQDGCQVSFSAHGKTLNGTLSGDKVSGSGSFPEDGGTTYYTLDLTFSGGNVSGKETWTWQGQGSSCSGTDTIQGIKY